MEGVQSRIFAYGKCGQANILGAWPLFLVESPLRIPQLFSGQRYLVCSGMSSVFVVLCIHRQPIRFAAGVLCRCALSKANCRETVISLSMHWLFPIRLRIMSIRCLPASVRISIPVEMSSEQQSRDSLLLRAEQCFYSPQFCFSFSHNREYF